MWFGTKELMQEVACALTELPANMVNWGEILNYQNGGADVVSSRGGHRVFDMSWVGDGDDTGVIKDYQQGLYGNGLIYFNLEHTMRRNMMPPNWAAPRLIEVEENGWPQLHDTKATFSNTPANVYSHPPRQATYTIADDLEPFRKSVLVIPPKKTLHFGWSGSVTGTGCIMLRAPLLVPIVNTVLNPSPQPHSTGWSSAAGAGGTSSASRVAGTGVNGAFGYQQLYTVGTTGSGGQVGYGSGSASQITVTEGTTMQFSAYAKPNINQRLALRVNFYTSGNVFIGPSVDTVGQEFTANTFFRLTSKILVPAGATRAQVLVITQSGTGFTQWTGTRINLSTNPVSAVTTIANFLAGTGGAGNVVRMGGLGSPVSTAYTRATWTTATTVGGSTGSSQGGGVSALGGVYTLPATNLTYMISVYVRTSKATALNLRADLSGGSGTNVNSAPIPIAANTWTRINLAVPNTGLNTSMSVFVFAATGSTNPSWAVGDTLDVDGVLMEQSPTVNSYFDGSTIEVGRTISWNGTANASASTRSGDTLTVDRISSAPGEYFDGSAEFAGAIWDGAAYASSSTKTVDYYTPDPLDVTGATRMNLEIDGELHPYVEVYLTRKTAVASTVTIASMVAQAWDTASKSVVTKSGLFKPGRGFSGFKYAGAVSEGIRRDTPSGGEQFAINATLVEVGQWLQKPQ